MNTITRPRPVMYRLIFGVIAALGLLGGAALAQNAPPTPPGAAAPVSPASPAAAAGPPNATSPATAPAAATDGTTAVDDANDTDGPRSANDTSDADPPIVWTRDQARGWRGARFNDDNEVVTIGGDSKLAADAHANAVVSVFGSSTSAGQVHNSVVSVFGDTRVEDGKVRDSAVAVLGNNYINSEVDGDAVAILGDLELGPKARVHGDAVVVGGQLIRDPQAMVGGNVQHILTISQDSIVGFKSWLKHCLRYLRPLAFAPNLGWAWSIALGVLALYALFAVLFREPLDKCVQTLQERPGETIVASVLAMLLSPIAYTVLAITFIGVAFIPIASFAMLLATLFGKAVVLAWMGRGVLKLANHHENAHTAIAVLIGGAITLLLYVVPVVGFLVFNLLGILGFGVVVYTLMLSLRAKRRNATPPATGPAAGGRGPGAGPVQGDRAGGGAASADAGGSPAGAAPYTAGFSGDAAAASAGAAFGGVGSEAGATTPPSANGSADALSLPRAGFWIRMLALLIDTVLVGVVFSVLDHHTKLQLIALAAYGAIMWKLKGTTVGGIVCSLKIVRTDGRALDWSTAIVRALACFLSLVVCGLGFIWIAFDPGRQAWHDKIAGTAVVRVPQGVSLI